MSVGPTGTDRIVLAIRSGQGIILRPEFLTEYPLGAPNTKYGPFGPDLTFLEILPGECVGRVGAKVSFYPLDALPSAILRRWNRSAMPITHVGFPGTDYKTKIVGDDIHHSVYHVAYISALKKASVKHRNAWDYVQSRAVYTGKPASFRGVSGGPIWAMKIRRLGPKKFSITDSALIGINFWQTIGTKKHRTIRGHFIRSIYDTGWRNLPAAGEIIP